jgi:fumarate reductase subunit C
MTQASSATRVAPPRPPDGFWLGHRRYRSYVLFGGTGLVLSAVCVLLLFGIHALGQGHAAWQSYLASLGSLPAKVMCWLLLAGTLFFSVRWLRVGVKLSSVKIGLLPAPPVPVVWVAHFASLFAITALVLLILSGVIL